MTDTLKVACAQLTSTTDIAENIEISSELIREAHGQGAQLIGLPEVVNLVQRSRRKSAEVVKTEDEETSLKAYRELAAELGVWLHTGSLVIKLMDDERNVNRSFLIDDKGAIAATYDKIHMFDVDLENGVSFRESKVFKPGDRAVVAETPWCGLGMTVCYDVRFAYLYRALAKAGASVLMVPAAFTRQTGQAHWHILLQARAIETGCYVVAPAQCGDHEDGRQTYGHSLIVAPWGEILADGGEEPGVVMAELDFSRIDKARGMVPALSHDRDFAPPAPLGLRAAG
ncbi:MAG: carbon-nitrogen hydrolase family protein, partial [Pseudomonadota bacterium]|nr:carbon-nitrogen hydrolase family protein [Pseudomonadota bacterium]